MSCKHFGAAICVCLILLMPTVRVAANIPGTSSEGQQPASLKLQTITAAELKTKVERNEPVTIIDVRSTNNYVESSSKIKGAIHVKLRRLQSRLLVPPLKSVPLDRVIVAYCACPADEASIEAAKVLLAAGFKHVHVLKGGWQAWLKSNGPVEAKPRA